MTTKIDISMNIREGQSSEFFELTGNLRHVKLMLHQPNQHPYVLGLARENLDDLYRVLHSYYEKAKALEKII